MLIYIFPLIFLFLNFLFNEFVFILLFLLIFSLLFLNKDKLNVYSFSFFLSSFDIFSNLFVSLFYITLFTNNIFYFYLFNFFFLLPPFLLLLNKNVIITLFSSFIVIFLLFYSIDVAYAVDGLGDLEPENKVNKKVTLPQDFLGKCDADLPKYEDWDKFFKTTCIKDNLEFLPAAYQESKVINILGPMAKDGLAIRNEVITTVIAAQELTGDEYLSRTWFLANGENLYIVPEEHTAGWTLKDLKNMKASNIGVSKGNILCKVIDFSGKNVWVIFNPSNISDSSNIFNYSVVKDLSLLSNTFDFNKLKGIEDLQWGNKRITFFKVPFGDLTKFKASSEIICSIECKNRNDSNFYKYYNNNKFYKHLDSAINRYHNLDLLVRNDDTGVVQNITRLDKSSYSSSVSTKYVDLSSLNTYHTYKNLIRSYHYLSANYSVLQSNYLDYVLKKIIKK